VLPIKRLTPGRRERGLRPRRDLHGNGWLAVEVSDDGIGGADIALGTGLRGLSDRLAAIKGQFDTGVPSSAGRFRSLTWPTTASSSFRANSRPIFMTS
jgi:hypothetical protein